MSIKLLLDTDIGSDIDDAVALAYLLAQPQCDLLGITMVTGEGHNRAMLADALCRVAGRGDVPIHIGAQTPLHGEQRQPLAPQAEALLRWSHTTEFASDAVHFLRDTIRAHPHEVLLLPIGPLTNIAQLFMLDPEIPALLRGLVLMGGVFFGGQMFTEEWNIMLDPTAAEIVYRAPVKVHRSVGLDVTTQVRLPADTVRERFHLPLLRPVLDFAEVWFREQHEILFHDPLAAAVVFDDALCQFERGQVRVETAQADKAGFTYWQPATDGPHEIAVQVDADRFFEHFFATVGRHPSV